MIPYSNAESRYRTDATFRRMVDMLTSVIAKLEMTPAEIREAAIYACIRFEHLNMSQTYRYVRGGEILPEKVRQDMQGEADRCLVRARELSEWLTGDHR